MPSTNSYLAALVSLTNLQITIDLPQIVEVCSWMEIRIPR
jgi:hypothetical protein